MKKYSSILYVLWILLLTSCVYDGAKDFPIQLEEDKPKAANPIVSVQALDGDEWIDGVIDGRKITFIFRYTEKDNWNNISVRFNTDENAGMITPTETQATLDLSQECTVVTSDGYIPVEYSLKASEFQLIKNIKVTIADEVNQGMPIDGKIDMSFISSNILPAQLEVNLNDGVVMIAPADLVSTQDLSTPFVIKVKDTKTNKTKEYALTIKSDWEDITNQINTEGVLLPAYMSVLKNTNLVEREGNTGYIVKIPAGHINMKTSYNEKAVSTWFENNQYVSDVIASNRDFNVFVGGMSLLYWKPMTRPTVINDGQVINAGNFFWNIPYYTCPPTLAVKDGKASISYADIIGGNLYKVSPPLNGTTKASFLGNLWDVDAACSGYSYPLQGGQVMVSGESAVDYKALADVERDFVFSTVNGMIVTDHKINVDGEDKGGVAAYVSDAQRMARTLIGVNEAGDIMILVTERYADRNNVLIDPSGYPSDGTTLQEAATVLKQLGCSDAIAFHQIEYAVGVLQNGGTGKDLTPTVKRVSGDLKNSTLIMFK